MENRKNTTRFLEFEFLKALAMLGLPLEHTLEAAIYENFASESLTAFSKDLYVIDIFGPSIFMICMGFGIGGGKVSATSTRKTGIQFLLINAVLNLLRWFLPGVVKAVAIGSNLYVDFYYCFESDIYFFVGLFFILYSFIMRQRNASFRMLLLSMVTLMIDQLLMPVMANIEEPLLCGIVGNFVHVNDGSCFTLFSWAIFPTAGILLGETLKKNTNEFREDFMRKMTIFCGIFFVAFILFLLNYDVDVMKVLISPNNEYITDLPNVLMLLSIAGVVIGGAYYLCRALSGTRLMEYALRLSSCIIPFYMLQWILISWVFYALVIFGMETGSFGFVHYIIIAVSSLAISLYVSMKYGMRLMRLLTKITCPRRKRKKGGKCNA